MGIKKIDVSQIKYTPPEGEIVQNLNGDFLVWKDGNWNTIKMEGAGVELGIYEMNKQIIRQMPVLEDLTAGRAAIASLQQNHYDTYYMLYGKELSYFTVFKLKEPQYLADEVIECLKNVGDIKAMDLTENQDAVEIWTQDGVGPTVLYLFPYDNGIVLVGE